METWLQLDLGEGVLEEALYPSPFPWGCQGQGPLEKWPRGRLRSRSPHTSLQTRTASSSVGAAVRAHNTAPRHSSKLPQPPALTHTLMVGIRHPRHSLQPHARQVPTSSPVALDIPTTHMHSSGDPSTHAHTLYHRVLTASNTYSDCSPHIQGFRQSSLGVCSSKLQPISDFQSGRLGLTGFR